LARAQLIPLLSDVAVYLVNTCQFDRCGHWAALYELCAVLAREEMYETPAKRDIRTARNLPVQGRFAVIVDSWKTLLTSVATRSSNLLPEMTTEGLRWSKGFINVVEPISGPAGFVVRFYHPQYYKSILWRSSDVPPKQLPPPSPLYATPLRVQPARWFRKSDESELLNLLHDTARGPGWHAESPVLAPFRSDVDDDPATVRTSTTPASSRRAPSSALCACASETD
jgi:hypothetical protein